jgi:hypothetical protein
VKFLQLELPSLFAKGVKIPIHEASGKEKGLVAALEGCEDFYHPVDHLSPVDSSDLMALQVLLAQPIHFL